MPNTMTTQQLMTMIKAALARFRNPKLQASTEPQRLEYEALRQTAQVFTAADNVGELANNTDDPETAEILTVAGKGLIVPLVYILGQTGSYGHVPSDLREQVVSLLADFEVEAPALARRIRERIEKADRVSAA
jgi:hypothetical protein